MTMDRNWPVVRKAAPARRYPATPRIETTRSMNPAIGPAGRTLLLVGRRESVIEPQEAVPMFRATSGFRPMDYLGYPDRIWCAALSGSHNQMAEERAQRRLAAILAADVVGYSRLMEHDEAGALTAIGHTREVRRRLSHGWPAGVASRCLDVPEVRLWHEPEVREPRH